MTQRKQAIETLCRARDMLADRLTERIVELQDELLEEAVGLAPHGRISALHEELGMPLAHVTNMISNLPAEPDLTDEEFSGRPPKEADSPLLPALPPPKKPISALLLPAPDLSLDIFTLQVRNGNFAAAARTLEALFGLESQRAMQCALEFASRCQDSPELISKALRLDEHAAGATNRALRLLWECFGLDGYELVGVAKRLQGAKRPPQAKR